MDAPAVFALRYRDEQVQRAIDALGAEAPKALARAINRSIVSTRTVMQRKVAVDTKLKVGVVREAMRIEKARPIPDGLRGRIIISGARVPLYDFRARQTRRGVTADVGRGRTTYPGAFIATMKSGHRGVFARKVPSERKSRGAWGLNLPIVEKFGPSLPHVFTQHMPAGLAAGEASLAKNLAHELAYALTQASKQGRNQS